MAGSGHLRSHLLSDEGVHSVPARAHASQTPAQSAGVWGQPCLLLLPSFGHIPPETLCHAGGVSSASTQRRWPSAPPQPARARRCRGFVCMFHRHLFPIASELQIWKYEPPAALWVSVARCLFCMPVTSLSTVRTPF